MGLLNIVGVQYCWDRQDYYPEVPQFCPVSCALCAGCAQMPPDRSGLSNALRWHAMAMDVLTP